MGIADVDTRKRICPLVGVGDVLVVNTLMRSGQSSGIEFAERIAHEPRRVADARRILDGRAWKAWRTERQRG